MTREPFKTGFIPDANLNDGTWEADRYQNRSVSWLHLALAAIPTILILAIAAILWLL